MTERAEQLMNEIWEDRNSWADTETKLVAAIIRRVMVHSRTLVAQKMNNLTVIDKDDLQNLSNEVENLS